MIIDSDGNIAIGRDAALNNYAAGSTTTRLAVTKDSAGSGYHEVAHFTAGSDSNDTGAIVRITQFNNDRGLYIKSGRGTSDQAKAIFGLRNSSASDADFMTILQGGDIGINASSPNSRLSIYDADGHNLTLSSHNWSGEARIGFTGGSSSGTGYSNGGTAGALGVTASAPGGQAVGYMSFYTNVGDSMHERMRITHDGQAKARTLSGNFHVISSTKDGSTSARAATSAWEIKKTLGPAATTGFYYLKDPYDGTVAQWWCDMSTDGGGWILIASCGDGQMSSQSTSAGNHWSVSYTHLTLPTKA